MLSTILLSTIRAHLTQRDPVDTMLAGGDDDPPDRGRGSGSRAHRTVSLLPMVRAALEGLLFAHTASAGSGGLDIATASSSSSGGGGHVNSTMQGQGLGHVHPSPLHIWLTCWRRSSTSDPLTRLISNMLTTLLHEQRRQPCSSVTTLHVPHTGRCTEPQH